MRKDAYCVRPHLCCINNSYPRSFCLHHSWWIRFVLRESTCLLNIADREKLREEDDFKVLGNVDDLKPEAEKESPTATTDSVENAAATNGDSDSLVGRFNPLTDVSRGSGYKFFVTLYGQPAVRIEHYMQKRAVSRRSGYTHRPSV